MAGLSVTYDTQLLESFFKTEAFTVVTGLEYSLHGSDPGKTGANELSNLTDLGYARVTLNPDPDNVTNSNYTAVTEDLGVYVVQNLIEFSWPMAQSVWNNGNPISYFGAFDPNSSLWVFIGTISPSITVFAGQQVIVQANALTVTAL